MKNTFIITMLLFLASCASQKELATKSYNMWVKGVKVDCTGVTPMKCLQVQKNESIVPGEWQNFYGNIEGFKFIGGKLCKLRITEQKLPKAQVLADGLSIKYKLVEVLENLPDPIFELHDIWVLDAIVNKSIQSPGNNTVLITPSIKINITEMTIMGTDGCNQFSGSIKNVEKGIVEFGNLASTMKMCINMEIPDTFNKAMTQVKKYRRGGLKLHLLDDSGAELLTFKKVD
jgi:heat shock protein HslJ